MCRLPNDLSMKALIPALPGIIARSRAGFVLMLDFDGTLAPIVENPEKARMPPSTRKALHACALTMPVVIISGRALSDLRRRASVPGVWYAGNHGMEWYFGDKARRIALSRDIRAALGRAARALRATAARYRGARVENKELTLSLHFRAVSPANRAHLRLAVARVMKPLAKEGIAYSEGQEYVFNIRPREGLDKGGIARFALAHIKGKRTPIFIGDDDTDEDAFRALRSGITVRVGKNAKSAARYYVSRRAQVDAVMVALAKDALTRKRASGAGLSGPPPPALPSWPRAR